MNIQLNNKDLSLFNSLTVRDKKMIRMWYIYLIYHNLNYYDIISRWRFKEC